MMNLSLQSAKHFRDVHFGGNWTTTNMKEMLSSVTWKQATTKVHDFNTIATLAYHVSYFTTALLDVLEGRQLNSKDTLSFHHPPIHSEKDWEKFLNKIWKNAEKAALLIEKLPESKFFEDFSENKYGNYFRNIHGIIEHMHYHLGQMVLIKKLLLRTEK